MAINNSNKKNSNRSIRRALGSAAAVAGIGAGLLISGAGAAQAATSTTSTTNVHSVDWTSVTMTAGTCGANQAFALQGSQATVASNKYGGAVHVSDAADHPAYGDLTKSGQDDAVINISCDNGSGTADGHIADQLVVFSGQGGLHSIGVLNTTMDQQPDDRGSYLGQASVQTATDGNRFIDAEETFYTPSDPTSSPSGHADDNWGWDGSKFVQES